MADSGSARALAHPNELDCKRIGKMLRGRRRYRYVSPGVVAERGGYLVRSPCCSRSIDSTGGEIDIARIEYLETGVWRLYRKDDHSRDWKLHSEYLNLKQLLDILLVDSRKEFWR